MFISQKFASIHKLMRSCFALCFFKVTGKGQQCSRSLDPVKSIVEILAVTSVTFSGRTHPSTSLWYKSAGLSKLSRRESIYLNRKWTNDLSFLSLPSSSMFNCGRQGYYKLWRKTDKDATKWALSFPLKGLICSPYWLYRVDLDEMLEIVSSIVKKIQTGDDVQGMAIATAYFRL